MCDGSTATKMTVQFNLFGGTLLKLGTEKHRKLVEGVDSLENMGAFALTEVGYGNNASNMKTTITFDPKTDELVINTPSDDPLAAKIWITNGALHATHAVVFGQLMVHGKCHGVHGVVARIRTVNMVPMTGVTLSDMGGKQGCNGVDNAKIVFSNLRVPRENLLDRYSQLTREGEFSCSIEKVHLRFLTVADQLVSGRLCLASFGLGGMKVSLSAAVRYSSTRKQFSPATDEPDVPILKYLSQQRALLPAIASTYAYQAALDYAKQRYSKQTAEDSRTVVQIICALKPLASWAFIETAQTARERCGGAGYLEVNQLSGGINDGHAAVTAEGDNVVLHQKVAREVLGSLKAELAGVKGLLALADLSVLRPLRMLFLGPGDVRSHATQLELFALRERYLAVTLGLALQGKKGKDLFWAWNANLDVSLALARAYGEKIALERLHDKIRHATPELAPALERLASLFALSRIEADRSFVTMGCLTGKDLAEVGAEVNRLCEFMADEAVALVDSFGLPPHILTAPIANDWVEFMKSM
jgi:acyl-CoA oxidase